GAFLRFRILEKLTTTFVVTVPISVYIRETLKCHSWKVVPFASLTVDTKSFS
ncbi:hypothetical protein GCK32_021736, partial [Trichostrongylus colubriformis]